MALRMPLRPGAVDGGSTANKGERGSVRHIQIPERGSHLQATVETDRRRSSYPAGVRAIPATQAPIKGSGRRVFLSAERPERGWV